MKPFLTALVLATGALSACTPVVVGSTAVLARSVVQERSTRDALADVETEVKIATGLARHSGELFRDVSVEVVEGRVLLTGSVPERDDRVEADRIAWTSPGVVSVANELTVGEDLGTAAYLRDVDISNQLRFELLRDLEIRSVNFNVETVDRVVHLTGLARSDEEHERAIAHARRIAGVQKVVSLVLLIDDPARRPALRRAASVDGAPPPA